jgi:hypothetical protein
MNKVIAILLSLPLSVSVMAQQLSQTVRGVVVDRESQVPLPGASVYIPGTDPVLGAMTDGEGRFRLEKVPVGRHDVAISYIGYETFIFREVMITSSKETVLTIELTESVNTLTEVEVKAHTNKGEALNTMSTVSARQLSVEEAGRYAGGSDDFARLASSFAGVSTGLANNGIVIRGNPPKGLLWRMEGVEISNPNHFANMATFGGGGMTALSSHMLANSDFFTGAFPAEYGNALSGVFDLSMRTGNNEQYEHAFQIGGIGIDLASEGPFKRGGKSSYLFNYRYSTLALIQPILPPEAGKISYQDLSWKINVPTLKYGTFSFWGIAATDGQKRKALEDPLQWEKEDDRHNYDASLYMGASGLSHRYILNRKAWLHSVVAVSGNGAKMSVDVVDSTLRAYDYSRIDHQTWRFSASTLINYKINARHTNRTGLVVTSHHYSIKSALSDSLGLPMITRSGANGNGMLLQAFSQSSYSLSEKWSLKTGIHALYFALNNKWSLEPRAGLTWNFSTRQSVTLAYGLHSQTEPLSVYFAKTYGSAGSNEPNKGLGMGKAHHLVLGYDLKLGNNARFRAEPFLQLLYNIPVVPGSYVSMQNAESVWFFNDSLTNIGKGMNAGIDLTLERFLKDGFYYLVTASFFESTYTGGDGVQRSGRYNKRYVANFLVGKEWNTGKQKNNVLSVNARLVIQGGDRLVPVDISATMAARELVYDESRAFEESKPASEILSFSINYRINKKKHASTWSLHIVNVLGEKEMEGYRFDPVNNTIVKEEDPFMIPNVSYKIEF